MEEREIFDQKFVHFMWDESLIGGVGVVAWCELSKFEEEA